MESHIMEQITKSTLENVKTQPSEAEAYSN